MSEKDEFLKVRTYEEYDKRRYEFKNLDIRDEEILQHLDSLYPKPDNSDWENGIMTELYKVPVKHTMS